MKKEHRGNGCVDKGCAFGDDSDVLVNGHKRMEAGKSKEIKCEDNLFRGADIDWMTK